MQKLRLELAKIGKKTWWLVAALFMTIVIAVTNFWPPSTEEILNQGINFGDWQKTENLCQQVLAHNPDDADALVARARLSSQQGNNIAALKDCNKALVIRPNYTRALLLRGIILCEDGDKLAGEADFKSLLEQTKTSNDLLTLYRRASAFDAFKNYQSALNLSEYIVVHSESATSLDDLSVRATAQARLKHFASAKKTLAKLPLKYPAGPLLTAAFAFLNVELGDTQQAIKQCAAVAQQAPKYYVNEGIWGRALELENKYDEAVLHYDKALAIYDRYLYGLRRRGWCNLMREQEALALADLNKALVIEPDDICTLLSRASVYHNLNKHTEAIADCNRVIALDAKTAQAWCQRGDSEGHQKQWEKAHASLSEAIKLSPQYESAYINRAWINREMGNFEKASADLSSTIAMNSKSKETFYSRGMLYRDQKQYGKAIADLSAAIQLDPTNAVYYCARGCAEVRNGDYKQSIADCNKSIELNPKRLHPYLSRGEAYSALGNYDKALQDLNHCLEKYSTWNEALTERAKVYGKLHKTMLAADDLARLKSLK